MENNNNNITISVETITPKMALEMLSHHLEYNRTVSMVTVDKLERDIKSGNWQLIPYPISIAEDGTVLDGQHRLTAIARGGIAVPCYVARNVPNTKEVFLSIDTGRPRTFADAMRVVKGDEVIYRNTTISAVARLLLNHERGYSLVTNMKYSNSEVLYSIEKYMNICRWVYSFCSRQRKVITGSGFFMGLIWARASHVSDRDIQAFVDCINENEIGEEKYNWKAALKFKEDYVKGGLAMKSRTLQSIVETQKALYSFIKGSKRNTDKPIWEATPYQLENFGNYIKEFDSNKND